MKSPVNGVPVTTVGETPCEKAPDMADIETADENEGVLIGDTGPTPDTAMLTPMTSQRATPRALMVRKLADIAVLPAGRISSNERSLTADILLQVLDKVEEELRVEVAQRVARVAESPPALLRMLMLDEPAVAEKIIRGADTLPEALLIETSREGSTAHRILIAHRADLSTAVADSVLQFDEPEVCKLVLRREECVLSPNAINTLVALSATRLDLQPLLLRRSELEPAHGFMMFWWVNAEMRRRILARFAMDRSVIQDALADLYPRVFRNAEADPFVKEILVLCERRHRPRGVNGEPVSMDVVKRTLSAALKYPAQEIVDAVGMIAGLSRELAARILRDQGGEAFAVLCKALGVPRGDFYGFFEIASDEDGRVLTEDEKAAAVRAEYLLGLFDSMARDFARAILRYWDWDGNPRIAHITRLLGLNEGDEFGEQPSALSAL